MTNPKGGGTPGPATAADPLPNRPATQQAPWCDFKRSSAVRGVAPKESTKEFVVPGDVFVCENYTEKIKEKVFASNTENVDVEIILGMDIAKHYSAVIDTHAPALYFYTK